MDRPQLADFLRRRRAALRPEDVAVPRRAQRRRTAGLRREEVAELCAMSVDYYSRLEQGRSPRPSSQMLAAIAHGLRLTPDERDHLFWLAGESAPDRVEHADRVSPGLARVMDQFSHTPAQVMTELGETLVQTPAARALFGDETVYEGHLRALVYRWYVRPETRAIYPDDDHAAHGRAFTADLRSLYARRGPSSRAGALVAALSRDSPEFVEVWEAHEVGSLHSLEKRFQHEELGLIDLQCQKLYDRDDGQSLLVFTATPSTASADKLDLLSSPLLHQLAAG